LFHVSHVLSVLDSSWGRRDRMVVGYITTYAISVYHH